SRSTAPLPLDTINSPRASSACYSSHQPATGLNLPMRHSSLGYDGLVELRSTFLSKETDMGRLVLSIVLVAGLTGTAFGQTPPASEIAPGGKLHVGMIAITVLGGVAEPVAGFVGQKLGAAVEPVMYANPDAYLQSFGKGEWDIAIGPRVLAPT